MKKKKAERLDKILQVLTMINSLDKGQIEEKVQEEIFYSDLLSIRTQKYNSKNIVVTRVEKRHRYYKLTADGAAFKNDVGFVTLQKNESRSRRNENINLIVAIVSVLIAVAAFLISLIQSNKQSSQYDKLEKRIDLIERGIK